MNGLAGARAALFGVAARRAAGDYLKAVSLIMFILLAVAWTIDLAQYFPGIRKQAHADLIPLWKIALPYLWHRTADILVRLLPFATFFGVYLAEVTRRLRLESAILSASGSSPTRQLAPLLAFSLAAGIFLNKLEADWRPAAVAAQIELGHGAYADRYAPRWIRDVWFVSGDTAVRATIMRGKSAAMRDVLIFTGIKSPELMSIHAAKHAAPVANMPGIWRLSGVEIWSDALGTQGSAPAPDQTLGMGILPVQVMSHGIATFFLPSGQLRDLAALTQDPAWAADAQTSIWRRRTAWLVLPALALLAAALARRSFSGRTPVIPRMVAMGVSGLGAVVLVRVFRVMGELGTVPGPIAVFGSLAILYALGFWLTWREH